MTVERFEMRVIRLGGAALCAASIFLIGYIDCISDERIDYSTFYFIPITIASVFLGKHIGALMILTATAAYYLANNVPYAQGPFFLCVNVFLHAASFMIIGMAFGRLKEDFDRIQGLKRKLSRAHRKLEDLTHV